MPTRRRNRRPRLPLGRAVLLELAVLLGLAVLPEAVLALARQAERVVLLKAWVVLADPVARAWDPAAQVVLADPVAPEVLAVLPWVPVARAALAEDQVDPEGPVVPVDREVLEVLEDLEVLVERLAVHPEVLAWVQAVPEVQADLVVLAAQAGPAHREELPMDRREAPAVREVPVWVLAARVVLVRPEEVLVALQAVPPVVRAGPVVQAVPEVRVRLVAPAVREWVQAVVAARVAQVLEAGVAAVAAAGIVAGAVVVRRDLAALAERVLPAVLAEVAPRPISPKRPRTSLIAFARR